MLPMPRKLPQRCTNLLGPWVGTGSACPGALLPLAVAPGPGGALEIPPGAAVPGFNVGIGPSWR